MRFIGDVHGKWRQYFRMALSRSEPTFQVGDFGIGYDAIWDGHLDNAWHDLEKIRMYHRAIRGNHDNPASALASPFFLPDTGYVESASLYWVAGAHTPKAIFDGIVFDQEEQSTDALEASLALYNKVKPNVMVSHDLPSVLIDRVFNYRQPYPNRTINILSDHWHSHRPKVWIAGHHHKPVDTIIDGCRVIVLAELQTIDVDLSALTTDDRPVVDVYNWLDTTIITP